MRAPARLSTMPSRDGSSACVSMGCTISQTPFRFSIRKAGSAGFAGRDKTREVTSCGWMEKASLSASADGFSLSFWLRRQSKKYTAAPRRIAPSSTNKVVFLIMCVAWSAARELAALPPNVNPRKNHETRQEDEVEPLECARLPRGERDAAVRGRFGTNRDQVLVLRQPVDRVVKEVAIFLLVEIRIRGEYGIADD